MKNVSLAVSISPIWIPVNIPTFLKDQCWCLQTIKSSILRVIQRRPAQVYPSTIYLSTNPSLKPSTVPQAKNQIPLSSKLENYNHSQINVDSYKQPNTTFFPPSSAGPSRPNFPPSTYLPILPWNHPTSQKPEWKSANSKSLQPKNNFYYLLS